MVKPRTHWECSWRDCSSCNRIQTSAPRKVPPIKRAETSRHRLNLNIFYSRPTMAAENKYMRITSAQVRVKSILLEHWLVLQSIPFLLLRALWEISAIPRWQFLLVITVWIVEGVSQSKGFWQMPRDLKTGIYHPATTVSSHPALGLTECWPMA